MTGLTCELCGCRNDHVKTVDTVDFDVMRDEYGKQTLCVPDCEPENFECGKKL